MLDYKTKGDIHTTNQVVHCHTTRRQTRRWPTVVYNREDTIASMTTSFGPPHTPGGNAASPSDETERGICWTWKICGRRMYSGRIHQLHHLPSLQKLHGIQLRCQDSDRVASWARHGVKRKLETCGCCGDVNVELMWSSCRAWMSLMCSTVVRFFSSWIILTFVRVTECRPHPNNIFSVFFIFSKKSLTKSCDTNSLYRFVTLLCLVFIIIICGAC